MSNDFETKQNTQPVKRRPLAWVFIILIIITASFAGLLGVCATGKLDWYIQELMAGSWRNNDDLYCYLDFSQYFSEDYFLARKRFIEYAHSSGALTSQLLLTERGPNGEPLTIDIAWLGSLTPKTILLHTSGLHGVEGFAGSAIQLKILENRPTPPKDGAIILIHILNPYGMAWLRRYNESNVDLNRNFRFEQSEWQADSSDYAKLDNFLNPQKKRFFDSFILQALYVKFRYGTEKLRNTIPVGQNFNPKGLFYFGNQLEEGPTIYKRWLNESLSQTEYMFIIDVHTGLGRKGQESLFHKIASTNSTALSEKLNRQLTTDFASDGVMAYAFKGSHFRAFEQIFDSADVDFITQEFGTYPNLYVLQALRDENRYHHYFDRKLNHSSKQRLKEAFSPDRWQWQSKVVNSGVTLFEEANKHIKSRQLDSK